MKTAEEFKNGQVLLIDKPLNWTSFQVVNKLRWKIRKTFNIKKIKVGLLVICTGKMTKQINTFQGQEKEYTGTFTVGSTTPSYDLESEINATFPINHITSNTLQEATKQFVGEIDQFPPIFSALKKDGKRLYEFARAGETVQIPSRKVTISQFELTRIALPEVDFRVVCSKGTYIRSLAHDFGKALNSGAHLSALRRTRIGDFDVKNSQTIEEFLDSLTSE